MESQNDVITSIRKGEDFNEENFHAFMLKNFPDWPNQPIEVNQFSAGFSNWTYLIRCGSEEVVMRRPPGGPLPPKAHDMERESSLLNKLHPVFPYVPKPYLFCDDESVIGVPFYVMERKNGIVFDTSIPAGIHLTEERGRQISYAFIDTLAELHKLDYKEIGLESFGRPQGFLERQVHGWIKRYENSKTHEVPQFDKLAKWFTSNIPLSYGESVIHNDYKMNNMMFSNQHLGKVEAIFDWEMSTIADPIFDLAISLSYWREPGDSEKLKTSLPSVTSQPGFLSRNDLIERYALKSGRDIPALHFYLAFAYFKTAVVMQQIYYRWVKGSATDPRFSSLNQSIDSLMEYSYEIINTKTI
ncbi:phosphotransferase family protein [Bacillus sp. FJAT-29814]|uniref:phosphotransferase family protein n=1 Tax=Bacillus sp. FJAT-29814 TaxID=1729688 RepID=UPI00082AA2BE|nr:phosphotransferase family protein [Bacillus sp. FJAT-29814]